MGLSRLEQIIRAGGVEALRGNEWLASEWLACGRPEQIPPDTDWRFYVYVAGRGAGKTRSGAEWVNGYARKNPGHRIALVSCTAADSRDVVVRAILENSRNDFRPLYEPTKTLITWPNGAEARTFSAEEPERLRGPQFSAAWCFIAGTSVETSRGKIPIETVLTGDMVLTRDGFKRVRSIGNRPRAVGSVSFSNGVVLTGTEEHPVLTQHGWMTLKKLSTGCVALTVTSMPISDRRAFTEETENVRSLGIDMNGKDYAEKYPPDTSCITSTKTHQTIQSKTSSVSHTESTEKSTQSLTCSDMCTEQKKCHACHAERSDQSFTIQRQGSAKNARASEQRIREKQIAIAFNAEKLLDLGLEISAASVVSTWEDGGNQTVYNIEVEDKPEYFANGILVHNCDEMAAWKYLQDTWDMLQFGMRLGRHNQVFISTTPRPLPLLKEIMNDEHAIVVRGSTFDNAANLSPTFVDQVKKKYEGTRLGRQELYAEMLDDAPGAMWKRSDILYCKEKDVPQLKRVVVAVDPAISVSEESDETGIIVAGLGIDGKGYVLSDLSGKFTPDAWARRAMVGYETEKADSIIFERNQGGDMVEHTIRTVAKHVACRGIVARRGKALRAEPISALYEQRRVYHVGAFPELEDQMTSFDPLNMPEHDDRVDALVYAFHELMVGPEDATFIAKSKPLMPRRI